MMTDMMKGNQEVSVRSPIGVGSLSLTKIDHAGLYGRRCQIERRS